MLLHLVFACVLVIETRVFLLVLQALYPPPEPSPKAQSLIV